jgi:hypothetical protein
MKRVPLKRSTRAASWVKRSPAAVSSSRERGGAISSGNGAEITSSPRTCAAAWITYVPGSATSQPFRPAEASTVP